MNQQKGFYVYLIRDPRPGKRNVAIYVGKGKGKRAQLHFRYGRKHYNKKFATFLIDCLRLKRKPQMSIVRYFKTDYTALQHERALIRKHGRLDRGTGTLFNLTDGGQGTSGWSNKRLSKLLRKLWADPKYRKKHLPNLLKVAAQHNVDPEVRKANAKRLQREHSSKETSSRQHALQRTLASPKFRNGQSKRASQTFTKLWRDPQQRKSWTVSIQQRMRNPESRKACSRNAFRQWADPQFRKRNLILLRKRNASQKSRRNLSRKIRLGWRNPAIRARRIAACKAGWVTRKRNAK